MRRIYPWGTRAWVGNVIGIRIRRKIRVLMDGAAFYSLRTRLALWAPVDLIHLK